MQFRSVQGANSLPFLRHFAFSVQSIGIRTVDRDLFPAIAEFLRGRRQLKSLQLIASEQPVQRAVGFDAAIWGVLPSLEGLKGLKISYPSDLSPGLASWLIPRSVLALSLTIDYSTPTAGDSIPFLKVHLLLYTVLFRIRTDYIGSSSNSAEAYPLSFDSSVSLISIYGTPPLLSSTASLWSVSFTSGTTTGLCPRNAQLLVTTHLQQRGSKWNSGRRGGPSTTPPSGWNGWDARML